MEQDTDIHNILVRMPNWLGDYVIALGFLQACKDKYPNSKITVIAQNTFRDIPLPADIEGHYLNITSRKIVKIAFGLRKFKPDKFYVLPPSFSSALMAFLSGSRKRYGMTADRRSWLLTNAVGNHAHRRSHLLRGYLDLLDDSIHVDGYYPEIKLDPAGNNDVFKKFPEINSPTPGKHICISPGAEYGPAKQWPLEKYSELARELIGRKKTVVLLGTEKDRPACDQICSNVEGLINLAGKTDIRDLLYIMSLSEGFIGNDSGASHLAASLKIPQVVIFGSTEPDWTRPLNKHAQIIRKKTDCAPCFQRTCQFDHYNCLSSISADNILDALIKLKVLK